MLRIYQSTAVKLSILSFLILLFSGCKEPLSETESEEQDGMQEAMRQEFLMTQDPALGYIPRERLAAAEDYAGRQLRPMDVNAVNWSERGPTNIAGRVRACFVDLRDATGNTVFAASVSGGIWKATNFKGTPAWTPVADNMANVAVCALAQDSTNPNTMYAGTGEGWFNVDAVRGNGIYKTTDGGNTWTLLPATDSTAGQHNFDFIQDIVVHRSGVVFASARRGGGNFCNIGGVFRSANGGTSWTRVLGTLTAQTCDSAFNFRGADLELAANGDVYATTGFQSGGSTLNAGRIFRSSAAANGTNVGALNTWVDITPAGTWQRIDIACAPSNPSTVYALLQSGTGEGIGAIKRSTDFGASWTDLQLPTWCSQGSNSADFTNGQAWYDLIVQVDPNNSNTVYIGGIDLFRSTNGGANWSQITQWAGGMQPSYHSCGSAQPDFFPGLQHRVHRGQ
jgi:hypothetical protein